MDRVINSNVFWEIRVRRSYQIYRRIRCGGRLTRGGAGCKRLFRVNCLCRECMLCDKCCRRNDHCEV